MDPVRILHTNDFHGHLTPERVEVLRPLRESSDLFFDCGDLIKTGNLGIPTRPDPAWSHLAELRCTASVPGNRETHVLRSVVETKTAGAAHPLLAANWFDRDGQPAFRRSLRIDVNGLRVGVFGVMVAMVTDRMKTAPLSQYRWSNPVEVAAEVASELRSEVDLLIALTHIGLVQDRELARRVPEIDVILGGHSHNVLESPEQEGRTWIAQTGSHGRFVGVYEWRAGRLNGHLVAMKPPKS